MKKIFLLPFFLLLLTSENIIAQAGTLDTTFGVKGKMITTFSSRATAFAVSLEPDGRIVLGGTADGSNSNDFAVSRYHADGKPDRSFGNSGKIVTDFQGLEDEILATAIQPDGKIVAAGESRSKSYNFALARYNINGTLDTTFNHGGKVITDFGGSDDIIYAMALQNDGKIVVAGQVSKVGSLTTRFALARYNTNGALDKSFGTNGTVLTLINSNCEAFAIAIQNDGKIIVAGDTYNGSDYDFAMTRYNSNGTLDAGFGNNGIIATAVGNFNDMAKAVAIDPDGRILLAGFTSKDGFIDDDFAVVRYLSTGQQDKTFGLNGIATMKIGEGSDYCNDMAIQSDGKIVLAGQTINQRRFSDFAVARFNSNGTIDSAFGDNGKTITALTARTDDGFATTLQGEKIIVAGDAFVTDTQIAFALVRYNGNQTQIARPENNFAANSTGINEVAKNSVIVYPNPASTEINFRLNKFQNDTTTLAIFDITGKLKGQYQFNLLTLKIDTTRFSNGNYYYKILQGKKAISSGSFLVEGK